MSRAAMARAVSTPLTKEPGTALHRQLFIVLRDQITRGFYPPGSTIPKEEELERLFGVSRITVRRAVVELERLGMVRKLPGKGTFVQEGQVPAPPAATLSLLQALSRQARDTQVKVLHVELVPAPGEIALQLELQSGQRAIHALRLRSAEKVPLILTETWLPDTYADVVTAQALRKQPLFKLLVEAGVKFGRVVQEMTAVAADPHAAGMLKTPLGSPLLKLTRLVYGTDGRPVQRIEFQVCPDRTRLLMEASGDTMDTLRAGHFEHNFEYLRRTRSRG